MIFRSIRTIFLLCGFVNVCCSDIDADSLHTSLLTDYNPNTLPQCSAGTTVQVKVGIALRQILELHEPTQILQSIIWLRLEWVDCRLVWNATDTGVGNLVYPVHQIWTPDVTLYDNADNSLGGNDAYRATVYPDGAVSYYFPSVIATFCKIDVTYFPFDTQTCPLKFGSWSYHGNELNFTRRDGKDSADTSTYKENGEWEIHSAPAVRHEFYYSCCPNPYPDVTFYVKLVRRSQFYLMNLIFPCVLMSSMAVFGFVLPPDSGEKVSLEITVLLSLSVFMLMVSEAMPPTSETFPYIGMYFACAMVLVSWSCLMTVTVLNVHYRGDRGQRVPAWIRTVFMDWLGRLLCVTNHSTKGNKISNMCENLEEIKMTDVEPSEKTKYNKFNRRQSIIATNGRRQSIFTRNDRKQSLTIGNDRDQAIFIGNESNEENSILRQQLQCMECLQNILEGQKESFGIAEEWQTLARILDRAFMIIFFIVQFTATLVLMVEITRNH